MDWLLAHLSSLSPSGVYASLVGVLLLCGLGAPIPEDISLISAGYLAHLGVLNVHWAFVLCFAAVLVGDGMAFVLGRAFGQRLLKLAWARRLFAPRKQLRVRAYFRKYGSKVVFVARFLPGLRFTSYFSAGMLHLRPSVFIIYDSLAAIISVPLFVYLAYYFGEYIDKVIIYARRSERGIVAIVVLLTAVFVFRAWRRKRRRDLARAATAATASVPAESAPPRSP